MAVDDAYSRYVMTLNPCRYLRLRGLTVGDRAVVDEVPCGVNGEYPSRVRTRNTLTAAHVISGSLLPAFPGGTRIRFNGDNGLYPICGGGHDTTASSALTTNYYGVKKSAPAMTNFSANFWYQNNVNPGAVNQRILCFTTLDNVNNGYSPFTALLHLFNWNSTDNMLVESTFVRRATLLGTGFITNPGNNEMYRYWAKSGNVLGTPHMMSVSVTPDSLRMFRDGVNYADFTWNPDHYRMYRPQGKTLALGHGIWQSAEASLSGYGTWDYSTADMSEFSLHNRALTDLEIAELYRVATTGQFSRKVVGKVVDVLGAPLLGRLVRIHRSDGGVLGEATSDVNGDFIVYTPASYIGTSYAVAFDDLGIAPDYNAAIQTNVVSVST
jgi:hypothetical protein